VRISFVVDGQTEYHYLLGLLRQSGTSNKLIGPPVLCEMQPYAPVKHIAYRIAKKMPIALQKRPNLVVVTIDLENREDCPASFASALGTEILKRLPSYTNFGISIVIKVRTFENWLVADLAAIKRLKLFTVSRAIQRAVTPNKADHVDALKLLKQMSKASYDKLSDGKSICRHVSFERIAKNSRSFRRCLRIIGEPKYRNQSKNPT
jgi:hypothetical protein